MFMLGILILILFFIWAFYIPGFIVSCYLISYLLDENYFKIPYSTKKAVKLCILCCLLFLGSIILFLPRLNFENAFGMLFWSFGIKLFMASVFFAILKSFIKFSLGENFFAFVDRFEKVIGIILLIVSTPAGIIVFLIRKIRRTIKANNPVPAKNNSKLNFKFQKKITCCCNHFYNNLSNLFYCK